MVIDWLLSLIVSDADIDVLMMHALFVALHFVIPLVGIVAILFALAIKAVSCADMEGY